MSVMRLAAVVLLLLAAASPGRAELRCGPFSAFAEAPAPRTDPAVVASFQRINAQVKTQPYHVLFFGDSITERWNEPLWGASAVWAVHMAPRGVLNAGVSGDRTEHLRWRLDHGNLDGPPPEGVVLLIGTNDLGHGRPPEEAAEGIRRDLLRLREKSPNSRILLLGLWPRGATAEDHLRREAAEVNKLIAHCADDQTILYADIGGALLEPDGVLSKQVSPDLLHFSAAGYERLVPKLDPLIDSLLR
jgi:lysophospholipase L1-like esterase